MAGRRRRNIPDLSALVSSYIDFLRVHRGLSSTSLRECRKAVTEFLEFLAEQGRELGAVRVEDLDGYVHAAANRGYARSTLHLRLYGLRKFLRYLFAEGWLPQDLALFVEGPLIYRDATVPPHYTWSEVHQLLTSVKGDDPVSLRDRAMLVLLCVYGLRCGEVASLTLDDLDWKHEVVRVPLRKTGKPLVLPLLPVVAAVLRQYIVNGRSPVGPHRNLLLTDQGRPQRGGTWVSTRLQLLAKRANLGGGRGGHAIRRAVGTRLVEQGWDIGAVAQVLGHERISSTRVYLRLSMELLRDVADNYGDAL